MPPLRYRQDDAVREIDFVCFEELGLVAERLAARKFGMRESDLVMDAACALGFHNITPKVEGRVTAAIHRHIELGRLAIDAAGLLTAVPQ